MPSINYKRRARLKLYAYSFLCVIMAGGLLWLNSLANWQMDWTAGARNTINESSIELLQSMEGLISLHAYFDSDSKTRQQLSRFIDKYKRFKQDISLAFVDNQLSSDQLIKMGFSQVGELKISYADNTTFINRVNEQDMTSALFNVARKEDTWLAVIQGHGERDPLDVGARNAYLGGELKLIEEFLSKGGNLLWLRDPAKQNYFSSLDETLGISLTPGVIIDANTKLRILLGIKHAAVIPVTEFHKHSITEALKTHLLFPFSSAINHQDTSNWQAHTLFKSLERSWAEVGEINTDKLKYEQDFGDTQGPLTIGLALSRHIEQKQQRVIVIGDSDFMANGYIGYRANFALSLNILNWLTEDDKLLSIAHRAAPDQSLELSDKDVTFIALILLLVVPVVLIGTGFGIRWRRHKH